MSGDRLILVTNDDGIHAPGIAYLADALSPLGRVVTIAPDRNQSGVSHMISLHRILRCHEHSEDRWSVEGSPADCVYLGVHELLDRAPDLVVSGVNSGPNLSFDVHYSGTVGAAIEGTLLGVPSIAVSLTDVARGSFTIAARFAATLAAKVLNEGLPNNTTLNVNVPGGEPTGYQMTFLGHRLFRHSVARREDPRGAPYFWIGGVPADPHDFPGSDCNAIADGLVSVTPLSVDQTNPRALAGPLGALELDGFARTDGVAPPVEIDVVPVR
ncbi:MAG: 5'/3'-nucleotidase SurE [Deltaproteobacteria bacterium]|jgi:5'-nucleotidase